MKLTDSSQSKKRLLFCIVTLIVGAIGIVIYNAFTGNENQVFTDVVNEFTALNGSNKSAEKNLYYFFAIIGGIIYSIYYLFKVKNIEDEKTNNSISKYVIIALAVFTFSPILIYKTISPVATAALLLAIVAKLIDKDLVLHAVSFYFIFIYALVGLYRIYAIINGTVGVDLKIMIGISAASTILLLIKKNNRIYTSAILLIQLLIPFLLLIYTQNKYKFNGEFIEINAPKRITVLIMLLIICFVIESIYRLFKNWNTGATLNDVICFGTYSSIMAFNQYFGNGASVNIDLHHSFEDIIGYSEIFEYHRLPFVQYIPISGMYSVVQGAFLKILGKGMISSYNFITNFYYLAIILCIVYLLKKHFRAEIVLFISVVYYVGSYNRVVFMIPIFLLLSLPKIIENKNLWLKLWILTSLFHGLYYPVYGAAVCLGFLPLGLYQILTYIKNGGLKNDVKRVRFWIGWCFCILPAILSIPLLLGTLKHMLAMASQTIFADGVTRFGQVVPDIFLPYINSLGVRLFFYYQASYLIIISIVWISIALFWVIGRPSFEKNSKKMQDPIGGFLALSIAIMALVSISYSVVRMEIDEIYSRSDGFIKLTFIVLVLLVVKKLHFNNKNATIVFAFACFIIAIVMEEGFCKIDTDSKMQAYYTVSDEYVHVLKDDPVDRLGECFIPKYNYDIIQESYKTSCSLDKNKTYLGIVGYFGEFYLDRFKGDSVLELYLTVKGYTATKETVDIIKQNDTIVGFSMDPVNNYYIYHYLVTSGDYIWWPAYWMFVPNDIGAPLKDIIQTHKNTVPGLEDANLGKTAGSWGSSIDSLEEIFTTPDINADVTLKDAEANIQFANSVYGDDADFVYIEFDGVDNNHKYALITQNDESFYDISEKSLLKYMMKKISNPGMYVQVEWTDDEQNVHKMECEMDEGKLLIPLGAGKGWLFDNHSELKITVTQDEEYIRVPKINEVRMLKLREVK